MISYVTGDLLKSPAQTLVNPVNTVGVMGKGLALQFKKAYPAMFTEYKTRCEQGRLDVGTLWLHKSSDRWILNFPTKKHWRGKSKIAYIEAGLQTFVTTYADEGITSAAFPMLGCGAGGLDWETQVKPVMEHYLSPLPIEILVYVYDA